MDLTDRHHRFLSAALVATLKENHIFDLREIGGWLKLSPVATDEIVKCWKN